MVHNFFKEKPTLLALSKILATRDKSASRDQLKMRISQTKELAEQLHKAIIRKFKKRKVHSTFIDNVWDDVLADMQLISKLNKVFRLIAK